MSTAGWMEILGCGTFEISGELWRDIWGKWPLPVWEVGQAGLSGEEEDEGMWSEGWGNTLKEAAM